MAPGPRRLSTLALCAAVLVACNGSGSGSSDITGSWYLVEIDGQAVEEGVNTITRPALMITGALISGDLGCNTGGVTYELAGDEIVLTGPFEATAQLCSIPDGGDEIVLSEAVLTEFLAGSARFTASVEDSRMVWALPERAAVFEAAASG